MSTCTCSCVDGYRIRRASCTVHGEQDAQVIAGQTVTIRAGALSDEHIGRRIRWGAPGGDDGQSDGYGDGYLASVKHHYTGVVEVEIADYHTEEI